MPARKSFLLRIDPALWAEIERLAHAELRSVNAQIEYLLRDAVARRGGKARSAGADADEQVAEERGEERG